MMESVEKVPGKNGTKIREDQGISFLWRIS